MPFSVIPGGLASQNDVAAVAAAVDTRSSQSSVTALQNALNGISSQIAAGTYAGKIDMVNRASGLADAGFVKAGGLGIPAEFFNTVRTAALPYTVGSSTLSASNAATGRRAVISENVFVSTGTLMRSYAVGTSSWTNLPAHPSGYGATTVGSVNSKVFTAGISNNGSIASQSIYTFDVSGTAWTQRVNLPNLRLHSGIADLQDARCALFGGKSVADSTAENATNITTDVVVFTDSAGSGSYATKTALPVRMSKVRTAVRTDKKVYLHPASTSDGTTLNATSRRLFLWDETAGTTELDPIPAECAATPWAIFVASDNTLIYVPTTTPSSGSRARKIDPSKAAGSQITNVDWDYNDEANYYALPTGCEFKQTSSGMLPTVMQVGTGYGLMQTYVAVQSPNWTQSFYQIKS